MIGLDSRLIAEVTYILLRYQQHLNHRINLLC